MIQRLAVCLLVALTIATLAPGQTLRLHYIPADGDAAGWGLNLWGAVEGDGGRFIIDGDTYDWDHPLPWTGSDAHGVFWDIPVTAADQDLGFVIHRGDDRDPGRDLYWRLDQGDEIWIRSGHPQVFTARPDPDLRLRSATSDGQHTVLLHVSDASGPLDAFHVYRDGFEVGVNEREVLDAGTVRLTLAVAVEFGHHDTVSDDVGQNEVTVRHLIDDALYGYDGDDLGCSYGALASVFKLWSPVTASAAVLIYDSPQPLPGEVPEVQAMAPDPAHPGVWEASVAGDQLGRYYLYRMEVDGEIYLTPDLHSVALSANSRRSQIVDLDATDPLGWSHDRHPDFPATDSVVYELHVRDLSAHAAWDGPEAARNRYLGVVATGTRHQSLRTGFDHLLNLGVNTVQLMPVADFSSADENDQDSRDWGDDPYAFNVPEGSYSSNPDDGAVRIRELKRLIQACHAEGVKVVLNVAFGYTGHTGRQGSLFDAMVPGYAYRFADDGSHRDGSGKGNELATEALMVRRFIKQSCRYWVQEFHADGLCFDLMGLLDTDLLAEITAEIKAINPHAVIYGEPWSHGGALPLTARGDQRGLGFGCFNDQLRTALAGSPDGDDGGYVMNAPDLRDAVILGLAAGIDDFTDQPAEAVNAISGHDHYTWWDKLDHRWNTADPPPGFTEDELIRLHTFGLGMLLTAQGIPVLHAGSEFLRTKRTGDPDQDEVAIRHSDHQGDAVNALDWGRRVQHDDVVAYTRGLIALRRARYELRLPSRVTIASAQTFLELEGEAIAYTIDDQTPADAWGRLLVVHNPGPDAVTVDLPSGQWEQVVDATHAGTTSLASYLSLHGNPLGLSVPGRSSAVLYENLAPALQLNLFQNEVLDRYLNLVVNVRDGSSAVDVAVNGVPVAMVEQALGTFLGSHELETSGELAITVATANTGLTRRVTAWNLAGGVVGSSIDGRLEVTVPPGARPAGWLVIDGEGPWLLGRAGVGLSAPATLRVQPTEPGQVLQAERAGQWTSMPTTVTDDGRLEAEIRTLGRVRLARGEPVPRATRLLGNTPNPFNPSTSIRFELGLPDAGAHVRLGVFDVRGRLVRMLVDGPRPAGRGAAVWDGRDAAGRQVASGVYIYRLETGQHGLSGRMLLLK